MVSKYDFVFPVKHKFFLLYLKSYVNIINNTCTFDIDDFKDLISEYKTFNNLKFNKWLSQFSCLAQTMYINSKSYLENTIIVKLITNDKLKKLKHDSSMLKLIFQNTDFRKKFNKIFLTSKILKKFKKKIKNLIKKILKSNQINLNTLQHNQETFILNVNSLVLRKSFSTTKNPKLEKEIVLNIIQTLNQLIKYKEFKKLISNIIDVYYKEIKIYNTINSNLC